MSDQPQSIGMADADEEQQQQTTTTEQSKKSEEEVKVAEDQQITATTTATATGASDAGAAQAQSVMKEGEQGVATSAVVKSLAHRTADSFFTMLCREKADAFAISGAPSQSPIWVCGRDDKINDVLNGMIKRNILSVPVLLKTGKYYGFIDIMDVVKYVVKHFGATQFQQERSFVDLLTEEKKFLEKTVADIMEAPLTLRNPYHPIHSGYSAFAVVEALARETGLHRVSVVNEKREVINLVTQSQCVRFLNEHVGELGSINNKTIAECKRVFKEVISVSEDTIAIDAFNLMVEKGLQGVAIVNSVGRLRGNLSIRDLKICGADMSLFWRLHQTVKNFVLKLRHEFQARHGRPRQVMYVTPQSTIMEVVQALASHAIHRLYVCNNHLEKKPIGVVSLQDLLLEIVESA